MINFSLTHAPTPYSRDAAECKNVFALITKDMSESEEKRYAFSIEDESICKEDFLISLSRTICDNLCRADYVSDTHPHFHCIVNQLPLLYVYP